MGILTDVFLYPLQNKPKPATTHLCPGLNASIVQLVLHIWQGYFKFSYYFIFD